MYYFDEDPDEEIEEPQEEQEEKAPRELGYETIKKLLETRTILLFGEINMKVAERISQQLLLLASDSDDDIKLIINSPGGHVESGDTIFDMIRFVKPKVKIIGTGWVASAGALIFVAADKENRYSLPNTRFLLHQPMGGTGIRQASDIAIEAEEIIKMRRRLNETFAEQTGQPIERVEKDTERNFWLSAVQAKEYGLVSKVITSMGEVE
ncbi:MAG: ATP-dependent Clp protease proteolytic subunit [Chloroflexota bacterium]